jgi:hypothetical protein
MNVSESKSDHSQPECNRHKHQHNDQNITSSHYLDQQHHPTAKKKSIMSFTPHLNRYDLNIMNCKKVVLSSFKLCDSSHSSKAKFLQHCNNKKMRDNNPKNKNKQKTNTEKPK